MRLLYECPVLFLVSLLVWSSTACYLAFEEGRRSFCGLGGRGIVILYVLGVVLLYVGLNGVYRVAGW
jgi:hypothetical protein